MKSYFFKKGFTLMEVLVYVGILSIIIVAVISFVVWAMRSDFKARVARETLNNAQRAIKVMVHEIKEAQSVYDPASDSSQLSLETTKYSADGEETSYIDFFLCGTRLCFKKEGQNPIALTSDNIEITNLDFNYIILGSASSVQINLEANYKNPFNRADRNYLVNLTSTASLRSY